MGGGGVQAAMCCLACSEAAEGAQHEGNGGFGTQRAYALSPDDDCSQSGFHFIEVHSELTCTEGQVCWKWPQSFRCA